jgi:hypothetical protein
MTIENLDVPVAPPVAVGSSPSAQLLSSSDPGVVTVDAKGNLVAHRNGEATISATRGGALRVVVNAVTRIEIVPGRLELMPASQSIVRVVGDGRDLPPEAIHWETSDPKVGVGSGALVRSNLKSGTATLTARSGSAQAKLELTVSQPRTPALRIAGSSNTLRVGTTMRLQAEGAQGIPVQWTTSNARVLEPIQQGVYQARGRGSAKACAVVGKHAACQTFRVTR